MWKFVEGFAESALAPITDVVSEVVTDKDKRDELLAKIRMAIIEAGQNELAAKRDIIVAEAQSDSWLASNWRPILMLSFTAIIVNNYILSPYLQAMFDFGMMLEIPADMWSLLKIGVGGYVVGRSGEKISDSYFKSKKDIKG